MVSTMARPWCRLPRRSESLFPADGRTAAAACAIDVLVRVVVVVPQDHVVARLPLGLLVLLRPASRARFRSTGFGDAGCGFVCHGMLPRANSRRTDSRMTRSHYIAGPRADRELTGGRHRCALHVHVARNAPNSDRSAMSELDDYLAAQSRRVRRRSVRAAADPQRQRR